MPLVPQPPQIPKSWALKSLLSNSVVLAQTGVHPVPSPSVLRWLMLSTGNACHLLFRDNDKEKAAFVQYRCRFFSLSISIQLAEMQNLPLDTDCSALVRG